MKQVMPRSLTALLARGEEAIGGLDQFGAALNLSRVTKPIVTAKVGALRNKRDAYDTGTLTVKGSRSVLNLTVKSAVDYMQTSRDSLKRRLGKEHNLAWVPAGFPSGFSVSSNPAKLQERVYSMATFLAANPTFEVPDLDVTAVRGETLFNDLKAARNSVNLKVTELGDLRTARNSASKELDSALRQLVSELSLAISPLDERWTAFGLNKPGVLATPDVPQNITAVLIGNNAAAVKWNRAPRAEHYRVWMKVNGVDQELVATGSPNDTNFTIEGVPANATIEIAVSAVNNGGESAVSQIVSVVTH